MAHPRRLELDGQRRRLRSGSPKGDTLEQLAARIRARSSHSAGKGLTAMCQGGGEAISTVCAGHRCRMFDLGGCNLMALRGISLDGSTS